MTVAFSPTTRVRLARPCLDLETITRFYVTGLGLNVLHRNVNTDEYASILILGVPGASWHLEFAVANEHQVRPTPTAEDLLVMYLGRLPSEATLAHLEACGGRRVPAMNPYWDEWGVTLEDPDGYRVVLCAREWAS